MGLAAAFLAPAEAPVAAASPDLLPPLPSPALPLPALPEAAAAPDAADRPLPESLLKVLTAAGAELAAGPPTRLRAKALVKGFVADGLAEGSSSPKMSSSRSSAPLASTLGAAAGLWAAREAKVQVILISSVLGSVVRTNLTVLSLLLKHECVQ